MATQDKYEKIGAPDTTADDLTGTPIGTPAPPPPEAERLVHTPIAGGTPAPTP